jgi:predicted RecB family nuclease
MKHLSAIDIQFLYRPSQCLRRVDLRRQGLEPAKPDPYSEVLRELGIKHEENYRSSLKPAIDLSSGSLEERFKATVAAVNERAPSIYQPVLIFEAPFASGVEIVGIPDFFILENNGYIIRDCKISRRINEKDHPEIIRQVDIYGWLYHKVFGQTPVSIDVFSGLNDLISITFTGGDNALSDLKQICDIATNGLKDYEPVGWSKCSDCAYVKYCWDTAILNKDPAILPGVDKGLARELSKLGVKTYEDLLNNFTEESLSDVKRQFGSNYRKVGNAASSILNHAHAFQQNKTIQLIKPEIPISDNYVMFDVEGLPPQLDGPETVYLWGLMLYNSKTAELFQPVADFGPTGDKNGWDNFLKSVQVIFDKYGDIPFVHWSSYEKTKVKLYTERYGDNNGTAARILKNLCDLLAITKKSVILPDPSYSIKVVERRTGFKRTMDEYGGNWSMAQYIKAIETEDNSLRQKMMNDILRYNKEDLEATWAVLQWLQTIS